MVCEHCRTGADFYSHYSMTQFGPWVRVLARTQPSLAISVTSLSPGTNPFFCPILGERRLIDVANICPRVLQILGLRSVKLTNGPASE